MLLILAHLNWMLFHDHFSLSLSQLKPYIQFNATKYPPEDPRTRTMAQPVNN